MAGSLLLPRRPAGRLKHSQYAVVATLNGIGMKSALPDLGVHGCSDRTLGKGSRRVAGLWAEFQVRVVAFEVANLPALSMSTRPLCSRISNDERYERHRSPLVTTGGCVPRSGAGCCCWSSPKE